MNLTEELLLRIFVGTFLGGVIGYERDVHHRPAGLRTHTLVALASATFMVVSTHFHFFQHYPDGSHVEADASRIASSVVSGIGFLAGGAILRTGISVQGLTTAAGLWLVAAVGLSAGGGMYAVSVVVTLIAIFILTLLRRFQDKNDRIVRRKIVLHLGEEAPHVSVVLAAVQKLGAVVAESEYEKILDEKRVAVTLDVRLPVEMAGDELLKTLEAHPGVRRVRVELLG